jgi:acetyl esterase/lipase
LSSLYTLTDSYALPSLHIIGRSDFVVPSELSKALARKFKDPVIAEHEGGHVVAATPEVRRQVGEFLEARLRDRDRASPRLTTPPSADVPLASPERRHVPGSAGAWSTPDGRSDPDRTSPASDLPLWRGRTHPRMRFVFPSGTTQSRLPAFLVFQGGAYSTCFGSGGGSAEWLAEHGIVGVSVEYATSGTGGAYPDNYADAARAIRLVRENARAWGIDEHRIGVLGYSAGGHLASLLSTQPDLWLDPKDDLAGRVSARPDLVALAYPVISFVEKYRPGNLAGTVDNFFGRDADDETLRRQFSNELHVTAEHPPVFLWTTADDNLVPAAHSNLFAQACRGAGVRVTFELYAHGPHGMGLALGERGDVGQWTSHFLDWVRHPSD